MDTPEGSIEEVVAYNGAANARSRVLCGAAGSRAVLGGPGRRPACRRPGALAVCRGSPDRGRHWTFFGKKLFPSEDLLRRPDPGGIFFKSGNQRKKQALDRWEIIPQRGVDDVLDAGFFPERDHSVCKQVHGDQHTGAGIIELVFQLMVRIQGVVHDRDAADLQNGIITDNAWDNIGKKDGDPVALPDPERSQGACDPVNRGLQVRIGHPVALKYQSGFQGEAGCGFV